MAANMTRLYNTHPTQGFAFNYNSRIYVFQPKLGEWKWIEDYAPHPTKPKRKVPVHSLQCVDPKKKCRSWTEVPDELAKMVISGMHSGKNLETGEMDPRHHDGFIKEQGALEDELETTYERQQRENERLAKELEEKKLQLVALQAEVAGVAIQARQKSKPA